jgi:hypothetical protein
LLDNKTVLNDEFELDEKNIQNLKNSLSFNYQAFEITFNLSVNFINSFNISTCDNDICEQ